MEISFPVVVCKICFLTKKKKKMNRKSVYVNLAEMINYRFLSRIISTENKERKYFY